MPCLTFPLPRQTASAVANAAMPSSTRLDEAIGVLREHASTTGGARYERERVCVCGGRDSGVQSDVSERLGEVQGM
jgi:hypothetical protein